MVSWDEGVRALNHGTKDELVSGGSERTSLISDITNTNFILRNAITIIIIILITILSFTETVMVIFVFSMQSLLI